MTEQSVRVSEGCAHQPLSAQNVLGTENGTITRIHRIKIFKRSNDLMFVEKNKAMKGRKNPDSIDMNKLNS